MFIERIPGHKQIAEFVAVAELAVKEAITLFHAWDKWKDREGGYFCVAEARRGFPILVTPIGAVLVEKGEKYLAFCQEKAKRLVQHPDHKSSWESRNPEAGQWGGAISVSAFGSLIFSMSGFPELGDEAIMLVTAEMFFKSATDVDISNQLEAIANRSNNPYWLALRYLTLDRY